MQVLYPPNHLGRLRHDSAVLMYQLSEKSDIANGTGRENNLQPADLRRFPAAQSMRQRREETRSGGAEVEA